MGFTKLLVLLAAMIAICSSASVKNGDEAQELQIPFVPLADIILGAGGNESNPRVKRSLSATEEVEYPEEPALAYQTYRTCNYILMVVIDFTAGGGGSPAFDGGTLLYTSYIKEQPPAVPEYYDAQQQALGLDPIYPTFPTPWLGPFEPCTPVVINVTIINENGTLQRHGSFVRYTDCPCDEGIVRGDPHLITFDHGRVNANGDCVYILAQDCEKDPPTWKFVMTNGKPIGNTERRRIESGQMYMYGHEVKVFENGTILLDNEVTEIPSGGMILTNDLRVALMTSPNSKGVVVVTYDDNTFLEVDANFQMKIGLKNKDLKGKVCGLLGNDNDDVTDDFYLDGRPNDDLKEFADYWTEDDSCSL